ncbi:FYVE-FINGER-CONTAINING RAB5 EFFECTOR PROTEIN RABENOSYN-5-RELATED [Phytophthora cinnamomi]|uniref:FYVE-FINGER-CONTAINING RAB5 EFFECTOR PROTEIN RABENOSYN-5-RELATED n=1 Tax=Phytophthora cinnamomi TaxID=4785 RepID=UPI00355A43BD|nr:FYVE-FINGER-CONTAINING RAB5 EFFECTOR PROTEIN RABENOSYN-5-RELATED [Phytophthora cinnamomi]
MKFPLPRNIFPAVNLPPQEAEALENYATNVVRETRDYYHNFLTTRHGQVDPSEWKKLKQQDSFALYKQHGAAAEERRSAWRLQNPERDDEVVPLMLAVGSLDGTVEDCMLGLRTPTSQSMQLKSAMVEDGYVDWAVLGQLVKPSPSQPFHEVAVKWAVKAHPFLVGTVMRVRDIVYVETTGFTTITGLDGIKQPLGYHLKHSVDLPDVHELTEFNIVRARLSYCYLYRQRSERVVDVFLRGFVCAMGEAPELLVVSTVTEIVMSIPKNLECAKMYKLAYLLKHSTPPAKSHESCKECSLCKRMVRPAVPGDIHKICCVCCARVCSSCRVVHKMVKVSPYTPGVTSEKMSFCVRCVRAASEINASLVAARSVRDADSEAIPEHDILLWNIDVTSSTHSQSSSAQSKSEVNSP